MTDDRRPASTDDSDSDSDFVDDVEDAADSDVVHGLARFGLAARALVYLLVGVLAAGLAFGIRTGSTDQRGAMQEIASHPGGEPLVWLLAAGLFGYALWRLKEAAFGVVGDGAGAGPRLKSGARAVIYIALGVSTVQVALGARGSQSRQFEGVSGVLLRHTTGRWLVAAAGVVVLACGAVLVCEGLSRSFEKYFAFAAMSSRQRSAVRWSGTVGTTARGAIIGLSGVLVVVAAARADPGKAGGLDRAMRELAATGWGSALLVAVALGLMVFGVFGLAEARWRRT